MPCAIAAVPPALVERLPPMVQVPSDGSSCEVEPSASAAASRARCRGDAGFHRHGVGNRVDLADLVESRQRQQHLAVVRICPPTSPVLPPCGTMAVCVSLASLRIAATSSTVPGRNTSGVWP